MRYRICSGENVIETTDLSGVDFGMAVVSDQFLPAGGYADVQPVFRMKTDATDVAGGGNDEAMLSEYRHRLDQLDLRVETATGGPIPTGWIEISDFSVELGDDHPEAFQVSAHVTDLDALDAEHLREAKRAEHEWVERH